ncbi:MAG: hypothetical protein LBS53_02280 [Synergistaceae bacterium]|jgi:hypothetical protein|nr:hypothetical protein [Synergistaceae bacterium]
MRNIFHDHRFRISYNYRDNFIDHKKVVEYEFSEIKLSDIKLREFNKKGCTFAESSLLKFIQTDDSAIYHDFIVENYKPADHPFMTEEWITDEIARFRRWLGYMDYQVYDPRRGVIVVTKDTSTLIDGNHRVAWLWNKFGGDYKIHVLKVLLDSPDQGPVSNVKTQQ